MRFRPFIFVLPSLLFPSLLQLLLVTNTSTTIHALLEQDEWERFDQSSDGNEFVFEQANTFLRKRHQSSSSSTDTNTDTNTTTDEIINGDVITDPISYFVRLSNGCGGSLVHGDVVLTAAHCVEGSTPNFVRIGATTRTDGDYAVISDVRINSGYSSGGNGNDVAVLKLANFSSNTPVRLNLDCNTPSACNAQVYAIGFGLIDDVTSSSVLRGVTLNTRSFCEFTSLLYCNVQMVCADSSNMGTCAGDSGGPIVVQGTDLQIGVNSWSNGGCTGQTIDVYARVSNYYTWIQEQICALSSSPPDGCSSRKSVDSIPNRVARLTRNTAALAVGGLWKTLALAKNGILPNDQENNDVGPSFTKRYYRRWQGRTRRRLRIWRRRG